MEAASFFFFTPPKGVKEKKDIADSVLKRPNNNS